MRISGPVRVYHPCHCQYHYPYHHHDPPHPDRHYYPLRSPHPPFTLFPRKVEVIPHCPVLQYHLLDNSPHSPGIWLLVQASPLLESKGRDQLACLGPLCIPHGSWVRACSSLNCCFISAKFRGNFSLVITQGSPFLFSFQIIHKIVGPYYSHCDAWLADPASVFNNFSTTHAFQRDCRI